VGLGQSGMGRQFGTGWAERTGLGGFWCWVDFSETGWPTRVESPRAAKKGDSQPISARLAWTTRRSGDRKSVAGNCEKFGDCHKRPFLTPCLSMMTLAAVGCPKHFFTPSSPPFSPRWLPRRTARGNPVYCTILGLDCPHFVSPGGEKCGLEHSHISHRP
jgi:hypothetical protein